MQKIYFVFLSTKLLHLKIKSDWTYGIKLCNLYWLAVSDDIVLVIPAYHIPKWITSGQQFIVCLHL